MPEISRGFARAAAIPPEDAHPHSARLTAVRNGAKRGSPHRLESHVKILQTCLPVPDGTFDKSPAASALGENADNSVPRASPWLQPHVTRNRSLGRPNGPNVSQEKAATGLVETPSPAEQTGLKGPSGRHVYSLHRANNLFRAPDVIRNRSKRGSPAAAETFPDLPSVLRNN
jgi:hypothetical protein